LGAGLRHRHADQRHRPDNRPFQHREGDVVGAAGGAAGNLAHGGLEKEQHDTPRHREGEDDEQGIGDGLEVG
jgi:hypothetical protein